MVDITIRSYTRYPNPPPYVKIGEVFDLQVAAGTTMRVLLDDILGIPEGYVALVAVNSRRLEGDYTLKERDHVDLFPPVGGG